MNRIVVPDGSCIVSENARTGGSMMCSSTRALVNWMSKPNLLSRLIRYLMILLPLHQKLGSDGTSVQRVQSQRACNAPCLIQVQEVQG
jgi:hypothetical protein